MLRSRWPRASQAPRARGVRRLPVGLALLATVLTVPLASGSSGPQAPDVVARQELTVLPGRGTGG